MIDSNNFFTTTSELIIKLIDSNPFARIFLGLTTFLLIFRLLLTSLCRYGSTEENYTEEDIIEEEFTEEDIIEEEFAEEDITELVCKNCGAHLHYSKIKNGIIICDYCNTNYKIK